MQRTDSIIVRQRLRIRAHSGFHLWPHVLTRTFDLMDNLGEFRQSGSHRVLYPCPLSENLLFNFRNVLGVNRFFRIEPKSRFERLSPGKKRPRTLWSKTW